MFSRSIVLSLLLCCGCGAARGPAFINHTPHSDQFLRARWAAAQAAVIAGGEDLAFIRTLTEHTPPEILACDPRANGIEPHALLVWSAPDAVPGVAVVRCPQPCDVVLSESYSVWGESVVYARDCDRDPATVEALLEYEFTSQILWQLGYSVKWR
jgi:hypothetical protein